MTDTPFGYLINMLDGRVVNQEFVDLPQAHNWVTVLVDYTDLEV
jgi:hypothetical protein